MHDVGRRILIYGDALTSDLAFQNSVGVVPHRLDGVLGVPLTR
jgi:hypothetical protein